eukprot:4080507-Pyramimonas_sp.AAC.3
MRDKKPCTFRRGSAQGPKNGPTREPASLGQLRHGPWLDGLPKGGLALLRAHRQEAGLIRCGVGQIYHNEALPKHPYAARPRGTKDPSSAPKSGRGPPTQDKNLWCERLLGLAP